MAVPRKKTSRAKTSGPAKPTGSMRLQKFIAQCGVASRRKAEELIVAGKVRVNGVVVKTLGTSVDPSFDKVQVRNKFLTQAHKAVMLFYKPRGVVSTLNDPEGRPSLADYLTKHQSSFFPVGRLDFDSSGLIVLTNDGELAERLMHPRYELARTYLARVEGRVSEGTLEKLSRGVTLADGKANAEVRFIEPPRDARRKGAREPEQESTWLEITVTEGRNRLVRRMMERVNHPIVKLRRIAHGPFRLNKMRPGEMRLLTEKDYLRMRDKVFEMTSGED